MAASMTEEMTKLYSLFSVYAYRFIFGLLSLIRNNQYRRKIRMRYLGYHASVFSLMIK